MKRIPAQTEIKMRSKYTLLTAAFLSMCIASGCRTNLASPGQKIQVVNEARAIEIALEAVRQITPPHINWPPIIPRVVDVSMLRNGNWFVFVEQLPNTPGAHMWVEISRTSGKVVRMIGGA
jgi:hypothetical protein